MPWWNTVTNRIEYAQLPAKTIRVLPNENQAQAPIGSQPAATLPTINGTAPETIVVTQSSWLQWLFLALWLITLFAWLTTELIRRRNKAPQVASPKASHKNIQLALIAACKQQDGNKAVSLLLPWFNQLSTASKTVTTLAELKQACNDNQLAAAIDELQAYFYSNKTDSNTSWQSQSLISAVNNYSKQAPKPTDTQLPRLNP